MELAELRAEARVMRDAAFLAYGALKGLASKCRPAVDPSGAEYVCARLESLLFPPELAAEPLPPEKTIEQARTFRQAFEGHFPSDSRE